MPPCVPTNLTLADHNHEKDRWFNGGFAGFRKDLLARLGPEFLGLPHAQWLHENQDALRGHTTGATTIFFLGTIVVGSFEDWEAPILFECPFSDRVEYRLGWGKVDNLYLAPFNEQPRYLVALSDKAFESRFNEVAT